MHRFAWLLVLSVLVIFSADVIFGLPTLGLRIGSGLVLSLGLLALLIDAIRSWFGRIDVLGLAQLLEKKYPELAERLVTLVQIQGTGESSQFAPLLWKETAEKLHAIQPRDACPIAPAKEVWLRTGILIAIGFAALMFTPGFRTFGSRFLLAWGTPLVPLEIEMIHAGGYALRGSSYEVEAKVHLLDPSAAMPSWCELRTEDARGEVIVVPMTPIASGVFRATLEDLRTHLRVSARTELAASSTFELELIDPPAFKVAPSLVVVPPKYLVERGPATLQLDDDATGKPTVLQFSTLRFRYELDRSPESARILVRKIADSGKESPSAATLATPEMLAAEPGEFFAEVVLDLEHGISTTLPLGHWTVHRDHVPRFTQPIRLAGGGSLSSQRDYRIAPDDRIQLQCEVEDHEGMADIFLEWKVNDVMQPLQKWLSAAHKTKFAIDAVLPLPKGLKDGDRASFRLHVFDNRRLLKGAAGIGLPTTDLLPQVAIAPPADSADWFTLRVDRSIDSYLAQQTKTHGEELNDVIGKLKQKVQKELIGVEQLQRTTHQATAVTLAQVQQAEKLQKLNGEIADDFTKAELQFSAIPDLAPLAGHFLDIRDIDMLKSAQSLERFRAKERAVIDAEKDLQGSRDALMDARRKLDQMLAWHQRLAQDRLDQFHLDQLARRQQELAERLQNLLSDPKANKDEQAKEIDAIRQDQARIAERMAQLQNQSKLFQEALADMQQQRLDRLKRMAEELAMQQRAGRDLTPDQLPAEIKERLQKLAQLQDDLAKRVAPFAKEQQGPDVKPASDAADALKKPQLEQALAQQREHEQRLDEWLGKLLPSAATHSLREQILQLAKKQRGVHIDLGKLGDELPQLNSTMVKERMSDLIKRQSELPIAVAKLPIPERDVAKLRPAQVRAQGATQQAADHLANKDAYSAFFATEDAEKQLLALAALLPTTAPIDRAAIKDPALRDRIDRIEAFQHEQAKLRKETEKLRSDIAKSGAGGGPHPLQEKAEKLASDLLELSQKATNPNMKAMAKESADAVVQAKKAMAASQAMKAKGEVDQAKKMDDEAAAKLDLAVKQMAKLMQDPGMKDQPKENPQAAQSIKEGADAMRKAEDNLPANPKDAQAAMKAAAKNLAQAANQIAKQMASRMPQPKSSPGAKSMLPLVGGMPSNLPKEIAAELLKSKNWGELSGELKTQMMQDYRTRFGNDYAEMIRQYFEQLSNTPARKE